MEGDGVQGRRLGSQQVQVLVGCCMLLTLFIGTGHASAATHAFDPVLSLTGGCSVSSVDDVADPGPCPGTPTVDHPAASFQRPVAIATNSYGDIYVALLGTGSGGRIDIFDASGKYIAESEIPDLREPASLAVDSAGNLYVVNNTNVGEERVVRYHPTLYKPEEGRIKYSNNPSVIVKETFSIFNTVAINSANEHLFLKYETRVEEYTSAAEGNGVVGNIASGELEHDGLGVAVDAARGRLYASTRLPDKSHVIRVFELASPHALLFTIAPPVATEENLSVAADEGSGHVFLYDGRAQAVYEFNPNGTFTGKVIEHSFQKIFGSQIAIDNGKNSPNGALNPRERYLFVPSHPAGVGHSFAFGPPKEDEPEVRSISFANVGEAEAELEASIEPFGLKTHYTFEYITRQSYEEAGNTFAGGQLAGGGDIPVGNSPRDVAAAVEGLSPGTRYRFRVFAENAEGSDEAEAEFVTFPAAEPFASCPNAPFRTGFSALLPDCRALELVTPPDTNARTPFGLRQLGTYFPTREASPAGDKVSFLIEGGVIPGSDGTGSLAGDPYLAGRGAGGWSTSIVGPNGSEATGVLPGSASPDQGYSFWSTSGAGGSAAIGGVTSYVRYPDGHSALLGRGSLDTDPRAVGQLISEGGGHIVFSSGEANPEIEPAVRLEPDAPPSGTATVYDRTTDEVTHVISLLPEDKTPAAGENAAYIGASLDGKGVAFAIGKKLYFRYNNEETYEIGEGIAFAGIAEGGTRFFYLEGGRLWRFDATTEDRIPFSVGPVTPVNVSADGSTAYFVSTSILTADPNPNGAVALSGKENLYRAKEEEGEISFVGTVTHRDVVGQFNGNETVEGLGRWTAAAATGGFGVDPSRTTPDGSVLLFEARAALDGYDPEGHAEVYRYDFAANALDCLSCNPTLAPAVSAASLQSMSRAGDDPEPLTSFNLVGNLRADGDRAFFQSEEALVPTDVDGLQDVYEWEARGVGSCNRPGGCIYLVSSGHSLRIDYLYATSDRGDDVFFRTSDILLPRDAEETPSIYDARVGGGFVEPVAGGCEGEACKPGVSPAPAAQNFGSRGMGPSGNVKPACPKAKRKVRRHGKVVCVKKKKHKHHHRRHRKAGTSRGTGK
jgi:hypothetical protein